MNRRVQADNVFGMTYAEARRMAGESLSKIESEKSDTLRETSKWNPNKNVKKLYLSILRSREKQRDY